MKISEIASPTNNLDNMTVALTNNECDHLPFRELARKA